MSGDYLSISEDNMDIEVSVELRYPIRHFVHLMNIIQIAIEIDIEDTSELTDLYSDIFEAVAQYGNEFRNGEDDV